MNGATVYADWHDALRSLLGSAELLRRVYNNVGVGKVRDCSFNLLKTGDAAWCRNQAAEYRHPCL